MKPKAVVLQPHFRKMEFKLTREIPRFWAGGDPKKSHFANAFSVLLPSYERLFIAAVESRLKDIADPVLKEQARVFCAQEGQHAQVHRAYNQWLLDMGYSAVPAMERFHQRAVAFIGKRFSSRWVLALAAGGEHITTFMAHDFLSFPGKWSDGADPTLSALWRWHAAEEIEHKAVCFDVYQALSPGLWRRRVAFLFAVAQFLVLVGMVQAYLLSKDRRLLRRSTGTAQGGLWFGKGGIVTGLFREGIQYLRAGFHPWDVRDAALVSSWETSLVNGLEKGLAKG